MNIAQFIVKVLTAGVIVAAIWFVLVLLDRRDQQIETAAISYENCVMEEYHTTPGRYYVEHGFLPICGDY